MHQQILEFVSSLIQRKGKLPEGCDVPAFDFIDSGYVDSLAMIKFVLEIEEKYDISLSEEDMLDPRFRTIGGLASIIESKLVGRRS